MLRSECTPGLKYFPAVILIPSKDMKKERNEVKISQNRIFDCGFG